MGCRFPFTPDTRCFMENLHLIVPIQFLKTNLRANCADKMCLDLQTTYRSFVTEIIPRSRQMKCTGTTILIIYNGCQWRVMKIMGKWMSTNHDKVHNHPYDIKLTYFADKARSLTLQLIRRRHKVWLLSMASNVIQTISFADPLIDVSSELAVQFSFQQLDFRII